MLECGLLCGVVSEELEDFDNEEYPYPPEIDYRDPRVQTHFAKPSTYPLVTSSPISFGGDGSLLIESKDGMQIVTMELSSLQHTREYPIEFYVTFQSVDAVKGFAIEWELTADNIPKKISNKLHIKLEE